MYSLLFDLNGFAHKIDNSQYLHFPIKKLYLPYFHITREELGKVKATEMIFNKK